MSLCLVFTVVALGGTCKRNGRISVVLMHVNKSSRKLGKATQYFSRLGIGREREKFVGSAPRFKPLLETFRFLDENDYEYKRFSKW